MTLATELVSLVLEPNSKTNRKESMTSLLIYDFRHGPDGALQPFLDSLAQLDTLEILKDQGIYGDHSPGAAGASGNHGVGGWGKTDSLGHEPSIYKSY